MTLTDPEHWLVVPQDDDQPPRIIILDIEWYTSNQAELDEWMQNNLKYGRDSLVGVVLTFSDPAELAWFALKWS